MANAFNGAALFRARRLAHRSGCPCRGIAFNGAALFRARRRVHGPEPLQKGDLPSMGPRSFERGDREVVRGARRSGRPSMGPRSFERGDPWKRVDPGLDPPPSMGPRSFERGDVKKMIITRKELMPSMGPRSFERGDLLKIASESVAGTTLQWGRALSSAETRNGRNGGQKL